MCDKEVLILEDVIKNKPGEILSILYQIKHNKCKDINVIRHKKITKNKYF